MVRHPPRQRKIPGSNPACAGIFSGSSHTSDLKIGAPVATLPGVWRYRVSAGTGRPSISILWLGEMESLICNFYLSVAARKLVWADPSPRYSRVAGMLSNQQITFLSVSPYLESQQSELTLWSVPIQTSSLSVHLPDFSVGQLWCPPFASSPAVLGEGVGRLLPLPRGFEAVHCCMSVQAPNPKLHFANS